MNGVCAGRDEEVPLTVKLDEHQTRALALMQPGRVVVLCLGRGCGKSFLCRVCIHKLALEKPGRHIGILMPSLKQARSVFWPGLDADFASLGRRVVPHIDHTLLAATYSNGSRLTTWGAENAASIRGQRFDALFEDEADDIEPDVEAAVVQPTFSKSGESSIWVKTGTPRRGRYGGLFRDFKRAESASDPRYCGFRLTSEQSPQVDQKWLQGVKRDLLASQPTIWEREYCCNFDAADGLVYSMFVEALHVRRPTHQFWSEVLIGVDHGFEHPGVFIVVGVVGNGLDATAHVIHEVYKQHETGGWWDARAKELLKKWPEARWYADPSRPDRIESLRRAGCRIQEADNSLDEGVGAVADRLAVRGNDTGNAEPRLFVSPDCPNTLREFNSYRRKRDPKNTESVLDDIEKRNDDAMDALRYALFTRFGRPLHERFEW